MSSSWQKIVKGAVALPLLVGGIGIFGGVSVGVADSGVASAATTGGTFHCATPLGTEIAPISVRTRNPTIPKSVRARVDVSSKATGRRDHLVFSYPCGA